MFENLISQPATQLILDDIHASRLPPSILFSGPETSGKLTTALELARILSCEGDASWNCDCPACYRHRELAHPDLLLMGPRNCMSEIQAARAAFLRDRGNAVRYLFIRSIRKLLIRFNPVFSDINESRMQKAVPLIAELEEQLEEIAPSRTLPDTRRLEKLTNALVETAEKLASGYLYESIPIGYIRNAAAWAHLAPSGKKKVILIEHADRMQDASRNAFLKILEEPPPAVVFVLLTDKRRAILPTILSRVRTYSFSNRSVAVEQEVITRVFHDVPVEGEKLSNYFTRFLPVSPERISEAAARFINLILTEAIDEGRKPLVALCNVLGTIHNRMTITDIVDMVNKFKPGMLYTLFLTAITEYTRKALHSGSVDARECAVYAKWMEALQQAENAVSVYNITPTAALENLVRILKDAI